MMARYSSRKLAAGWVAAAALLALAGCRSGASSCCGGHSPGRAVAAEVAAATPRPDAAGPPAARPDAGAPDARPYGGQRRCPVTGDGLGSMGAPIPVTVNGQTVYVCCKGCASRLKRNPDAYLAKVEEDRAGR